ncbi:type II toxin-antitoxin system RelE/ParE family toxin [Pseudomonas aeruginosa]|uniref:type II toxin-antitoxin system RelE/ParE family toxin n=1 Tax=Pseudomonas aeruginosa TaxID=287 RepID=UPI000689A57D|nr:type II toxin-antitoxin system RelE/ParE family toxin [Pseudomonas aeruginosa]
MTYTPKKMIWQAFARRRYQALIGAALEAVATDPQQVGSISREELGAGLRSIHLVYCRSMPNVGKVVRPRHFVFYRVATDQVLEVVRVLHDSMELERHLARNRLR